MVVRQFRWWVLGACATVAGCSDNGRPRDAGRASACAEIARACEPFEAAGPQPARDCWALAENPSSTAVMCTTEREACLATCAAEDAGVDAARGDGAQSDGAPVEASDAPVPLEDGDGPAADAAAEPAD